MTQNLADPARILLIQSLDRFMEIGPEIEKLTEESTILSDEIAHCAQGLGFGAIVDGGDPVEFLVGDIKASVSYTLKSGYNVLTKKLKQV